jgi:(S)-2-hydroxyglutarate dehydrogenase
MGITDSYDIVVIGGGIVGTASAMAILKKQRLSLLLIEAENKLAAHQTGNNSGVIHSGLYYKPGSLKAQNCTEGRELMYRFCEENNIKHERCGKLVVAVTEDEIPRLDDLEKRGIENGLKGLKRLKGKELKDVEPHISGIEGLFVPQTGIVDYNQVTETYAQEIKEMGGKIELNCKFRSLKNRDSELILETSSGKIKTKFVVNCGGLYSDRIAKVCRVNPEIQIVPFRGEYYRLKKEKEYLVKNLVYPVPDPQFPFLGVHFTRMINGGVEAGPNAVLAFKREGYSIKDFSLKDVTQLFFYSGFWKMAVKYYKMGFSEYYRSLSKNAFVKALQKLIPAITQSDVIRNGAGVRAQALYPNGKLIDDFYIAEAENMVHILNAPSPAATASISIGEKISGIVYSKLEK